MTDDEAETSGEIVLVEREDQRWWPLAVSVGSSVLSALLATTLVLIVSHRQVEQERFAREELRIAQEEQRAALCALIVRWDDNARRRPPSTTLGKDNATAMAQLRQSYRCDQGE